MRGFNMAVFDLIFDKEVNTVSVICGLCALARNGLTTHDPTVLDLFTNYPELDGISASIVKYYYKSSVDTEHYVSPMDTNPLLLLPTPERAIVEYIQNEKWCDEGVLIEALKTYEFRDDICDLPLLYKVAEFFGLPKAELGYWIQEARDDEEV